jgi:hypothetical protein
MTLPGECYELRDAYRHPFAFIVCPVGLPYLAFKIAINGTLRAQVAMLPKRAGLAHDRRKFGRFWPARPFDRH